MSPREDCFTALEPTLFNTLATSNGLLREAGKLDLTSESLTSESFPVSSFGLLFDTAAAVGIRDSTNCLAMLVMA